jgi:amino acid transporter
LNASEDKGLVRGIGLAQATAANILEMVGVGPFLTIPLILKEMGGPQAMLGWLLGALVAICDGLVWAELGAALPGSGGSYLYLEEGFGRKGIGRLMSFLFLWGIVFVAPLSIASGGVGFSQYLQFYWPAMTPLMAKLIAAGVCLLAMALLYRDIPTIGKLSVAMCVVVLFTVGWVVFAGVTHFDPRKALDFPPGAFHLSTAFITGLGGATLIAMYDYGGYYNVCFFGGEVKRPAYVIPRSILYSIAIVAVLYTVMNTSIIGVIHWRAAMESKAIVSDMIAQLYGTGAARVMTALILWTAFASIFALMLGYSRVPYAAAVEGRFFAPFARLHATRRFPHISLLFLGATSALACAFELDALIKALVIIQIFVQSLAQIGALHLMHRRGFPLPFRMWLYPIPAVVAALGWLYIALSSGAVYVGSAVAVILLGAGLYLYRDKRTQAKTPAPHKKSDAGSGTDVADGS